MQNNKMLLKHQKMIELELKTALFSQASEHEKQTAR